VPLRKQTPAGRNAGVVVPVAVENPFAAPEPGPPSVTAPRSPVKKYIVPAAAPRPEVRAHGHVLTDRGWVREEKKTDG
jgi:hypothetical protein